MLGGHSSGSFVAFTESERVVGEAAVGQASTNPKHTVANMHLLLGQSLDACKAAKWAEHAAYRLEDASEARGGSVAVAVTLRGEAKTFGAEALTAMLLAQLKGLATAATDGATLTFGLAVPPWFSPDAKAALVDAAAIAGMHGAEPGDNTKQSIILVAAPEALCRVFAMKHPVEVSTDATSAGGDGSSDSKVHLFVDIGATHCTATAGRFFAPGCGPKDGESSLCVVALKTHFGLLMPLANTHTWIYLP